MADIIDQLIEIDDKANEILGDIEEERKEILEVKEILIEELREKVEKLVQIEMEEFEREKRREAEERIKQVRGIGEYFIAEMQKGFKREGEKWEEEIMEGILKDY